MSIIAVNDLKFNYGDGVPSAVPALDGVTFEIEKGDFVGVIGHTGSGKSTLMQMLNGLLKPDSGRVLFDGADIHSKGYPIHELRFRVGMVFQYPEYQLFEETVRKDIAFGPKNMGLGEEEIAARVEKAAAFCGLRPELLDRSPFDLSGGQKRRAAIAGVIAMEPDVLILDEPAAGLDPSGREKILDQIKNYHDRENVTVVLVSHSMEDIAKYCRTVIVLDRGKVLISGTAAEIFSNASLLRSRGLDVPELTKVLLRLGELGCRTDTSAYTLDAAAAEILRLRGGDAVC